jgi:hypothetical protein
MEKMILTILTDLQNLLIKITYLISTLISTKLIQFLIGVAENVHAAVRGQLSKLSKGSYAIL